MQRRVIQIRGLVQGVGFRPFVFSLASRLQLTGLVRNETGQVWIEVQGAPETLDQFLLRLQTDSPPLARIDRIDWREADPRPEHSFRLQASQPGGPGRVTVAADIATCADCLRELRDPTNRRYRYPFINCTNCGPRLTIMQGVPYDRAHTTMAEFEMCDACRAEYTDPNDRRFHAQPIACPRCGPRLGLLGCDGQRRPSIDPIREFAGALLSGQIGALKGIGGYHLVCLARDARAVRALRQRKARDEKPLAVMVSRVEQAERWCRIEPTERALLQSPSRPIVLLRDRDRSQVANPTAASVWENDTFAGALHRVVAPHSPSLGIMLPYTALHELLTEAVGEEPLVMTSGNRSDEPIAYRDRDAVKRLGSIADLFLIHDRPIHIRCDDSVTQVSGGIETPLRRSRGYAPHPIALPVPCPVPLLAVGGARKQVFALAVGNQAFLSHHLGDLHQAEAQQEFARDVQRYEQLFQVTPQCLVHDLHPDYASTRYAIERAADQSIPALAVQHHHAHLVAGLIEHQLRGPVIGVIFDGSGLGTDGTIWGGEFLVGDDAGFERRGYLRPVRLPGGDQAVRQPWRMALSYLQDADLDWRRLRPPSCFQGLATESIQFVEQMIRGGVHSPSTSSAGRLFDAVAALASGRATVGFEGQAAVEWEALATGLDPLPPYPYEVSDPDPQGAWQIDMRPLIRAIADEERQPGHVRIIARRFHDTLAHAITVLCQRIRASTGLDRVVLSGGVFLNALLSWEADRLLSEQGFQVFRHTAVPPTDGGLALGQVAIAAHRLAGL